MEAEKTLQSLENGNAGLEECAKAVSDILAPLVEHKPTDWNDYIATKQKEIDLAAAEIAKWETIIAGTSQKIGTVTADLLKAESEFRIFNEQYGEKENGLRVELSDLEERIVRLREGEEEIKRTKRKVSSAIEVISSKLAGAVSCPACGHEFMVSEAGFDVEAAREQLEKQQKEFDSLADCLLDCEIDIEKSEQIRTHLRNESRALTSSKSEWEARMAQVRRNVQAAEYEMEGQQFNLKRVQEFIAGRSQEIADARRKVFDEAFGMIDERGKAIDREKSTLQEEIQSATSAIDTLQATIEEMESTTAEHLIESLKESLKQYRMASADALTKKAGIEECLRTLEEQREYFVQFKTYLANTKIEALSKITNEFLENIGSDIRIRFSGYTVLKTGKVREKISVSLIRDGVDCGSFGKFSAGEAARVNLATILAMQKLINSNCDTDKGLDLLVLDEILEAVDEDGLSFMFGALQNLGVTSLVVSHGNIAESYPYKIMVVKENGESRLEQ
ncbi:hypothetical protein LJC45_03665 [Alistipes sp. OttesenSCG-928-B03]|nr:hypothetical protein [Alistipes sp. OttesenSCG-928-B03]